MPAFRFAPRGHGERKTEGPSRSSGKWNFANATGTLNLKGVLHVVLGKRSASMKSVTFTRPAKGNGHVTVKLAGHKVQLFTVTGKVKVKHSGATETLTGMTAKLTKAGATKLDKALHKNALTVPLVPGSALFEDHGCTAASSRSTTGTSASTVCSSGSASAARSAWSTRTGSRASRRRSGSTRCSTANGAPVPRRARAALTPPLTPARPAIGRDVTSDPRGASY